MSFVISNEGDEYIYRYDKSELLNSINHNKLYTEIYQSSISQTINSIYDDTIYIFFRFQGLLSSEEETILLDTITNHNPEKLGDNIITANINVEPVKETEYTFIGSIQYPGTNYADCITNIKISSYISNNVAGTYYIRAYDVTNNKIMSVSSFTNLNYALNDITNISNLPTDIATVELHCKVSSNTMIVSVQNFSIYY